MIHDMLKRSEINNLFSHAAFAGQLDLNTPYKQISDQMHFVAEEDRKLNSGDILVILGPSREIRAFKKDMKDELCKI